MKLRNKKTGETEVVYPSNDNELVIHFEDTNECQDFYNKLLAWKRLKDKGFRFFRDGNGRAIFEYSPNYKSLRCIMTAQESKEARADLDLLFGGEE